MRVSLKVALALGAAASNGPSMAQSRSIQPDTIVVTADASVETKPDIAILAITVRGEGKTPDDATRALSAKLKAVTSGLQSIDPAMTISNGSVAIGEARAGTCDRDSGLPLPTDLQVAEAADMLSEVADDVMTAPVDSKAEGKAGPADPCAIIGYVARSDVTARTTKTDDAGTAVGLAGRLGASDAGIDSFGLSDPDDASRRAAAMAIARARAQAGVIATGSGGNLGRIMSVVGGGADDQRYAAEMRRAPAVMNAYSPPPVPIVISPKAVTTNAHLVVTFALER
jgi:uncharacterized protein YggE